MSLLGFNLRRSQAQRIPFVMVDSSNIEVVGIGGGGLTVEILKSGGSFVAGVGSAGEHGDGWYYYDLTATETDTVGPLIVKVDALNCAQQNLLCAVESLQIGYIEFTYTVVEPVAIPIPNAMVWISRDVAGIQIVWTGDTDAFGIARDLYGNLPMLYPGTWYFWTHKVGYTFPNPDAEVVS